MGAEVQGWSLLRLAPEAFDLDRLPAFTHIFFYSKNGVRFFLSALHAAQVPLHLTIGAIGKDTLEAAKNHLKDLVPAANFTYLSAEDFVSNLRATLKPQGVLFPLAKVSEKSLHSQIPSHHEVIDVTVYSNQPLLDSPSIVADILVFTSPMNVQAYIQQATHWGTQTIIAIGQTTAKALRQAGCTDFLIAESPDELSLAQTVLSVLNR